MTSPSIFQEYGKELERLVRQKTMPLAVKMLEKEEDIPEGAIRPTKHLGYHLSLCQALSICRRAGKSIAMLKEDNWCFEPVIGLGLAEPPQYFLDGHNRFPEGAKTLEIGGIWAREFPRLPTNRYIGVVSAPLITTNFKPDLVMVYCDSAQLTQFLLVVNWMDGHDPICQISGHAACAYAIVPVVKNRQCQVTSPCLGDSKRALAQDNEIIFSFPADKLGEMLAGLQHLIKYGWGMPRSVPVQPEYRLLSSYAKIGKMIGLEIDQED